PFDGFVQIFPNEGAAPSETTELRVLYDDRYLYVGILCRDSQPERIARPLGTRDAPPPSDFVEVAVDFAHHHRTAYLFGGHPSRNLELFPYAAARLALRPQFSDPAMPRPRLADPSLDVGLDVRAGLTPRLQLNATVNPDFGQVEADQLILNLSNQEAFFPEKR